MPLAHFDGALAVVTGAGSGIGRAVALALAEGGASVVAADIDLPAAERTAVLAKTLGAGGTAYEVDVADAAAMEAFAAEVKEAHRVPDIVVNNAGIAVAGSFLDTGVEDWEHILGVNLWGVVHGCRLFGRQMRDRVHALPNKPDKPNFGGHIVNIASAAAFAPWRAMPPTARRRPASSCSASACAPNWRDPGSASPPSAPASSAPTSSGTDATWGTTPPP
ncbi:SDR family NAD(P)-dependent oxidoreductase [Actinomadura madurae]|nr:SDR family NAD(P)-dependent oxidoreductase [Actinomadura madurae]MCQ0005495.1 SDR family NAD(P)-dependent oxidoreductase [Actinomadura madurae]